MDSEWNEGVHENESEVVVMPSPVPQSFDGAERQQRHRNRRSRSFSLKKLLKAPTSVEKLINKRLHLPEIERYFIGSTGTTSVPQTTTEHRRQEDLGQQSWNGFAAADDDSDADDGEYTPECIVCCAKPKNILLQPCNHVCACKECASKLSSCPVCRKAVTSKVKIFL